MYYHPLLHLKREMNVEILQLFFQLGIFTLDMTIMLVFRYFKLLPMDGSLYLSLTFVNFFQCPY